MREQRLQHRLARILLECARRVVHPADDFEEEQPAIARQPIAEGVQRGAQTPAQRDLVDRARRRRVLGARDAGERKDPEDRNVNRGKESAAQHVPLPQLNETSPHATSAAQKGSNAHAARWRLADLFLSRYSPPRPGKNKVKIACQRGFPEA
jgi:hypothetical protein